MLLGDHVPAEEAGGHEQDEGGHGDEEVALGLLEGEGSFFFAEFGFLLLHDQILLIELQGVEDAGEGQGIDDALLFRQQ